MQPKILNHISVKDENETLGVLRNAGTTVYNRTDGKTYLLLKTALSMESLASFDDKKELRKPVVVPAVLSVDNNVSYFGWSTGLYGDLVPSTIAGTELTSVRTTSATDFTYIATQLNVKILGLDTIIVDFGAVHTGKVFTWTGTIYQLEDAALSTFIEGENRNDINLIFTL